MPTLKWSLDACKQEALKYSRRVDWFKARGNGSYTAARRNGWLDQCCAHMEITSKPDGYWTQERCMEDARKYSTRTEWALAKGSGYHAAKRQPWFAQCCAHMVSNLNSGRSIQQDDLFAFVSSIASDAISRDTSMGVEVDILVPSKKIAIEYNGLIFHSAKYGKSRTDHQKKSDLASKNGYRLIHIWSDEWEQKQSVIKGYLHGIIVGNKRKVFARNTMIHSIPMSTAREFLDAYHLQGTGGGEPIGVFHRDELIAVATFRHHGKELARWCVKNGVSVIGGLSKVVKHAGGNIYSFCDTAKHDGEGYLAAGFRKAAMSQPSYWYTDGHGRVNRVTMQKHKLAKTPEDRLLSERELAERMGFYQIGGCRQIRFECGICDVKEQEHKEADPATVSALLVRFKSQKQLRKTDATLFAEAKSLGILDEILPLAVKLPQGYWTAEKCKEEALKYQRRVDWFKFGSSSYNAARKMGIYAECCAHMDQVKNPDGYWTIARCKEDALRFNHRAEWWRNSGSSYNSAKNNGWLDECCAHMKRPVSSSKKWTLETCKIDADRFPSKADWMKNSGGAYMAAHRMKIIKQCCGHMKRPVSEKKKWTLETCQKRALEFSTKSQWQKTKNSGYDAALRNGWIDQCCAHMPSRATPRDVDTTNHRSLK